MSEKYIFNVDLDGVVYPFTNAFARFTGRKEFAAVKQITQWNFWNDWDMTQEEFMYQYGRFAEQGFDINQVPYNAAPYFLWKIADNFRIRIVTKRLVFTRNNRAIIDGTIEWLDKWTIPYSDIIFIGNGASKGDFECDVAIDDNPENLDEQKGSSDYRILMNYNYNVGVSGFEYFTRANDWSEVSEILDEWVRQETKYRVLAEPTI